MTLDCPGPPDRRRLASRALARQITALQRDLAAVLDRLVLLEDAYDRMDILDRTNDPRDLARDALDPRD